MKTFIRLALFAVGLAAVGYQPTRAQTNPFDPLEARIAALEAKFAQLDERFGPLDEKLTAILARLDTLSDPLAQAPARATVKLPPGGNLAAPVRYTTVCGQYGCAVVPVQDGQFGYSQPTYYSVSSEGLAVDVRQVRGGPLRRLFGRR